MTTTDDLVDPDDEQRFLAAVASNLSPAEIAELEQWRAARETQPRRSREMAEFPVEFLVTDSYDELIEPGAVVGEWRVKQVFTDRLLIERPALPIAAKDVTQYQVPPELLGLTITPIRKLAVRRGDGWLTVSAEVGDWLVLYREAGLYASLVGYNDVTGGLFRPLTLELADIDADDAPGALFRRELRIARILRRGD